MVTWVDSSGVERMTAEPPASVDGIHCFHQVMSSNLVRPFLLPDRTTTPKRRCAHKVQAQYLPNKCSLFYFALLVALFGKWKHTLTGLRYDLYLAVSCIIIFYTATLLLHLPFPIFLLLWDIPTSHFNLSRHPHMV